MMIQQGGVQMPQSTVLSAWKANYPLFQPVQKPPGLTIATTLGANAVPNKAMWATPTIQSAVDIAAAGFAPAERDDGPREGEEPEAYEARKAKAAKAKNNGTRNGAKAKEHREET